MSPSHMCCNCGQRSDLHPIEVTLKYTRYFLLAGTETNLLLTLPFCTGCIGTADRYRLGLLSKALITMGVFFVLMGALMFIPMNFLPDLVRDNLGRTAAILAVLLMAAYFRLRKPDLPRTSNDQPIYLRGLKRTFRGDIRSITLGFSNPEYAGEFRKANQDLCDSGALVIRSEK